MQELAHPEVVFEIDGEVMSAEALEERARQELAKLYEAFYKMRDRWVQHRATSGVESRWRRSSELYHGTVDSRSDLFEEALRTGPPARRASQAARSRVVINIVRPKVDQAVARMCEILFPTDDRNWGIRPTPNPQLASRMNDARQTIDPATGMPTGMTAKDEARAISEAAREMAEAMERSIDDSLNECGYNGECRRVIEDGVRLGSGVLKGPYPMRQSAKAWIPQGGGRHAMVVTQAIVPGSSRVDPWDVYFDPSCGNDHQRGRGAFHRRSVTRKELRALAGVPGYDPDAIARVLQSKPSRVRCAEGRVSRDSVEDESYELWEYHGEVEPEDIELLSARTGDPIKDVSFAVVAIVNDIIIGAMESWIDDGRLPYDVFNYRRSDDSPYGHGLPEELEHQQRVVNAAWRQVMDNGRASMGGQIVVKRGMIIPADGNPEITPMKLWYAKDEVEDVRQAMTTFEFDSHLEELLAVAQAAMQMADQETSMPQLLGGERGTAPETVGGMVMLHNNATAVLRNRMKHYDDAVTRPHISRYYDWKMANDPDPSIKGDFEVDARGSTVLLERDIQNQALINLAAITNNPRYAPYLKERAELEAILKAFRINPADMMKDEDEVKQDMANAPQQQDPRVVTAQITAQSKAAEIELKREQLVYNAERERAEGEQKMIDNQLQREIMLAEMQTKAAADVQLQERKERLEMLKLEDNRQRFNAEMFVKARQGSGI